MNRHRLRLVVACCALAAGVGVGALLLLDDDGPSLTRAEYVSGVEAICRKYGRQLDGIPPPLDIATPGEVLSSVGAALPILRAQTEAARALRPPRELRATVARFFVHNDRSLAGLDEALRSAKNLDLGGMGHGYVQFVRERDRARAAARAIGLRC